DGDDSVLHEGTSAARTRAAAIATAITATAATARSRTGTAISATGRTARTAAKFPRAKSGRGKFRERRHTCGIYDHAAIRTRSRTLTSQLSLIAQGNVKDAALTAVHRIKAEGLARLLHLFSRHLSAHA